MAQSREVKVATGLVRFAREGYILQGLMHMEFIMTSPRKHQEQSNEQRQLDTTIINVIIKAPYTPIQHTPSTHNANNMPIYYTPKAPLYQRYQQVNPQRWYFELLQYFCEIGSWFCSGYKVHGGGL